MRDSKSLLWEIPNHCYERFQIIVTRDSKSLLREIPFSISIIHPPSIFTVGMIWRRILSFIYSLDIHTTPPSIFTLRDFVAAIAGLFLRRLCDLPFYVRFHHYERFLLVFQLYNPPSIFTVGMIWRRILSTFPFSTVLFGWQTSTVHLYSSRLRRRFRRSILTALMRPPLFTLDSIITRDYPSMLREIPFSISIIQPAVYICYTLNDSYIYYWLLLCSRIFYHTTFFMMYTISLFTNKIETHFYPSYLSHHRVSNVIRLVLTWLYCSSSCKTGVAQWQSAGLITPRSQDQHLSPVFILHIASVLSGTWATLFPVWRRR